MKTPASLQTALKNPKLVALMLVLQSSAVKVFTTMKAIDMKNFKTETKATKIKLGEVWKRQTKELKALRAQEMKRIERRPPSFLFSTKYPLTQYEGNSASIDIIIVLKLFLFQSFESSLFIFIIIVGNEKFTPQYTNARDYQIIITLIVCSLLWLKKSSLKFTFSD